MSVTAQGKVTIPGLQAMKAAGEKSVCVVAWDYQIARIADMAGVDIVSVGDTVGINLWGQPNPLEITMDEVLGAQTVGDLRKIIEVRAKK